MAVVIIGVLTILTYGLPFFVFWIWARKLANVEDQIPASWRTILLWVGLSACTVAVGAFWIGLLTNPHTYPQEDVHFRRFFRFDEIAAGLGIGCALAGKGNGRWLVLLSGLGVGANWVWFAVLQ